MLAQSLTGTMLGTLPIKVGPAKNPIVQVMIGPFPCMINSYCALHVRSKTFLPTVRQLHVVLNLHTEQFFGTQHSLVPVYLSRK